LHCSEMGHAWTALVGNWRTRQVAPARSIAPKSFRQFGVAHGVLNILMPDRRAAHGCRARRWPADLAQLPVGAGTAGDGAKRSFDRAGSGKGRCQCGLGPRSRMSEEARVVLNML
jgi:hypothetical protein